MVAERLLLEDFYRVVLGPLLQRDALSTKKKLEDISYFSLAC